MAKSHRAPAGAVAVAAQVRALVADVGAKAAAQVLGLSAGRVSQMARASERGKIGGVITTGKGLGAWKDRITKAEKLAAPDVRQVIKRERQPEHFERSRSREGKRLQDTAGRARAQYSDTQIAKAAGISRQKATAIRLQMAQGKEPRAADRERFAGAVEKLTTREGIRDGIRVISASRAEAILGKMSAQDRAAHSADKRFTEWADVKNWVDGVRGAPSNMVKVYNTGTASAPSYSIVISYEENDDSIDDEFYDDEPYDEIDDSDYGDEGDE